jgi:hypothetical protein
MEHKGQGHLRRTTAKGERQITEDNEGTDKKGKQTKKRPGTRQKSRKKHLKGNGQHTIGAREIHKRKPPS